MIASVKRIRNSGPRCAGSNETFPKPPAPKPASTSVLIAWRRASNAPSRELTRLNSPSVRPGAVRHEAQNTIAILILSQFVMGNAVRSGKTLVHLPGGDAPPVACRQRVARPAVNHKVAGVGTLDPFREIADAITEQRHVIVGQGRDHQFADAVLRPRSRFQEMPCRSWASFRRARFP